MLALNLPPIHLVLNKARLTSVLHNQPALHSLLLRSCAQ